jgi:hypothetical protein
MPEPKPARAAFAVATDIINNNNGTYTPTNDPFPVPTGDQLNFKCTPVGECWVYFKDPGFFIPSAPNPLQVSLAPTQTLTPSGNSTQTGYAITRVGAQDPRAYPHTITVGGHPVP